MPWLSTDPNTNFPDAAARFDGIRNWITNRHANVFAQVQADMASSATVPEPSVAGLVAGAALLVRHRRVA